MKRLFAVPETVLQATLDYLGSRPWTEVDPIINGLRSHMIELKEDSTHEDVVSELGRIRGRVTVNTSTE